MAKNKAKFNKFLTGAVTATMVAAAVVPTAAAAETPSFPDVPTTDTHHKNIIQAVERGLFSGHADGTFKPYNEITRGQVAKVLARYIVAQDGSANLEAYAIKHDLVNKVTAFNDVPLTHGDSELVLASGIVKYTGVFTGSNNNLLPSKNITREQMAKVIVNAFDLKDLEGDLSKVKDNDKAQEEFVPFINILSENGVTDVEQFNPRGTVKRGQVASFLNRAYDVVHADDGLTPEIVSVTAANGKLTVQLNTKLETTPISSEFKIVQNINGTTKSISASSVAYDEETKTVTLVVPQISATEVDQNVSYTVGYKEDAAVGSNSFTIAKVGELKATGATQISSTQIKVQFNQKVTKASAETLANYAIGKADADGKISGTYQAFGDTNTAVELQEDEQSVIITLGSAEVAGNVLGAAGQFDNNTAFLLEVSTNVLPQAGKAAEQPAELPFTLNDSAKPTVEKFAVNEAGDLVVSFNEKLNTTPVTVVINGQALTETPVYSVGTGKSTVTFAKATLTGAKPTGYQLELGKTYSVSVADAQDAYGTKMNIYTSQFTYTTAAEAPQVTKVESKNEKSVTVTFSEAVFKLAGGALDNTNFNITKGAKHFSPATVTSNAAGTVYTLTFATADQADDFIFDSYKNETSVALDIHVTDIKDNVGNITPASKHAVTILKDTVKPEVVKKDNAALGLVDLTFNKAFHTSVTAGSVAGKAYVLTSTGLKLPLAAANVTAVTATPEGKLSFNLASVSGNALADGNYTLVLETGAVVDTALNGGNKNNEIRVPFIIAQDGLAVKPTVVSVNATAKAGDIVVEFNESVSYESAAKATNYTLDGQALPAASEFALAADGKTLTITLPEATFKVSGSKVLRINGVRNLAGAVMDQHEEVAVVSENEKIELKTAKVANGEVILTFNENVNTADVNQVFVDTDLLIKVNGVSVASPVLVEHDADLATPKVEKNQIRVQAPAGISFATGTITVEVKEDAAAKDAAGNGAKAVTVTAAR